MKLVAKHIKLVQLIQKFVPGSHVVIFHTNAPDPPHWTLTSCFGVFHSVCVHLGSFRNFKKCGAKQCEMVRLMQKFVPRSHIGIFCHEPTQSNPLDPKLTFGCVSYYLGTFGTIWLPCESRCKTGQTSAKVRATKSRRMFSQRTHPIHPIGPKTYILVRFILFGCIWDRLVALRN